MRIKKPKQVQEEQELPRRSLRKFHLNEGLPGLPVLEAELQDMWDVLLGRVEPPYWNGGIITLMEVADAYFARASEITALIQEAERKTGITTAYKKFRTGALRTFMEVAKRSADLGSRRITVEQMLQEQARLGRESA